MNNTEQLIARNGGVLVTGTKTGTASDSFAYLVVNEDAVFTTLEDLDGNDVKSDWGITTETITKGMILSPYDGGLFGNVVVASGSVLLIRG